MDKPKKPLGRKAYGSIPHLPESRIGPGDHHCHEGQARICTAAKRDKHDNIIVTEKLDGSCVAVARVEGTIHALGRAGWPALTSPHFQHRLFHDWAMGRETLFLDLLSDGEVLIGEWLAQAHGTKYDLAGHGPFAVFDLTKGGKRLPYARLVERVNGRLSMVPLLHEGGPVSIALVLDKLGNGHYGALDTAEGAVWRVERKGQFDFLAKFVRLDKVDGLYLPEQTGHEAVWNWSPEC